MHQKTFTLTIFLIFIAFICFPIHISGKEKPILYFIPGWLSDKDIIDEQKLTYEDECNALKDIFGAASCEKISWNSNTSYDTARDNADTFAEKLANRISKLPTEDRSRLVLIGHSLGGRITVKTLAVLNKKKIFIHHAVFLAAAIPNNDKDILEALHATTLPCINIYSKEDSILKRLFVDGNTQAFGNCGIGKELHRKDKEITFRLQEYHFEQEKRVFDPSSHNALAYIKYLEQIFKEKSKK